MLFLAVDMSDLLRKSVKARNIAPNTIMELNFLGLLRLYGRERLSSVYEKLEFIFPVCSVFCASVRNVEICTAGAWLRRTTPRKCKCVTTSNK